MNTVQNYVGRGNYANNLPQQAKNSLLLPSSADAQPPINPRIFQAQSRLLALVDKFAARGNYAPLQAASDLLHHWLSTPAETLTAEGDPDQLHAVLLLIDSLNEVYPINSLSTRDEKGEVAEPLQLADTYGIRLSSYFLNRMELTEQEEESAGVIRLSDDSMGPQLPKGSSVVLVAMDRSAYCEATGIVLLHTYNTQGAQLVGRVVANDGTKLLLVWDNPEFAEETVVLSQVRFMAQIRYRLTAEVI